MSRLFQLGAVTIESPGPFNATDIAEDFGADYAVKPLVGSPQDREFMGPADGHLTITGTLLPLFYARAGKPTGLKSVDLLRDMADTGKVQALVRGDGVNYGCWLVEKVTLKSSKLGSNGIGQVITYDIQLVRTDRFPDPADLDETLSIIMDSLVNLYG